MKFGAAFFRNTCLAGSSLLLAHHIVGVYFTLRLELAVGVPLLAVGSLAPYTGILLLVAVAVTLGFMRRWRWGAALFVTGVLLSAALCAYDLTQARWQINGTGHGATYTLWWWYYEPFWYGYRPGNV